MSLHEAPVATLSAHATLPPRMPIENAVDHLSLWYFDLEEPSPDQAQVPDPDQTTCWPLPEERSLHEPKEADQVPDPVPEVGKESEVEVEVSPSGSASASAAVTLTSTEDSTSTPPKSGLLQSTSSASLGFPDAQASPMLVHTSSQSQLPLRTPHSRRSSLHRASSMSIPSLTIGTINELEVTKFTIRRNEKSVMYHIDVRGGESQLQTYTIRRSYTDFKHLHAALTIIVESRKEHYMVLNNLKEGKEPTDRASIENSPQDLGPDGKEPWFVNFELPPLPSAGLLSFWRRHDRTHLQNRVVMFNHLLSAVMQHKELRDNFAMQKFLSVAPCAIRDRGSSYVSLCDYGVPQLAFEEESRERKKLARVRRRNSSASASATSLLE